MTNEPQLQVPLDGLFLSPIPPWGASVLVLRERRDVLLVRRRSEWGPPAVTRLPDEPIASCGARALDEIVGLTLPLWPVTDADPAWAVFVATTTGDGRVRLGNGYECCEWVPIDRAGERCTDLVSDTLRLVA